MFLKRFVKAYIQKHRKTLVLESFPDENNPSVVYHVVDEKTPLFPSRNLRRISFRDGKDFFNYSSVYLSKVHKIQPICSFAQRAIRAFFETFGKPERALVLGSAGCAIPRFLALQYKKCEIKGIEYSDLMVRIARKYFISGPVFRNFELIKGDAYAYVREADMPFNIIFVDLFTAGKISERIFSPEFLSDIGRLSDTESIVIFNPLFVSLEDSAGFIRSLPISVNRSYLFGHGDRYFIALVKTDRPELLPDFEKRLSKHANIFDSYTPEG